MRTPANNKKGFAGCRLRSLPALLLGFVIMSAAWLPTSGWAKEPTSNASSHQRLLLRATQVFDGVTLHTDYAVLVIDGNVVAIGPGEQLREHGARELDLGDATLLPGFIELHGHLAFQNVPLDTVLRHGVTTARDVGGPLLKSSGGDGRLRLLTAGPIITVPGGYPLPVYDRSGHDKHPHTVVALSVTTPEQSRQAVRDLLAGGATIIKIALEPGGEAGAPWSIHAANATPPWPMLSLPLVQAISDEAHKHGKRVAAHLSDETGVALALDGGVDEWAHMPCLEISEAQLQRAARQGVTIVATLDALSHCPGIFQNARRLAAFGAEILYGTEIAHPDIPWGIDANELQLMMRVMGKTPLEVLRSATSAAGRHLGLAPLGMLAPGAPADIIAVRGNALENLKTLEYPDLVMSGGKLVVNHFGDQRTRASH